MKVIFFSFRNYDRQFFEKNNVQFGHELYFLDTPMREDTAQLARGCDAICLFVNDVANEKVLRVLAELGIQLIAMRCAGYNNIDVGLPLSWA